MSERRLPEFPGWERKGLDLYAHSAGRIRVAAIHRGNLSTWQVYVDGVLIARQTFWSSKLAIAWVTRKGMI